MFETLTFLSIFIHIVNAQINLGSFNLNRDNKGDLLFGFGQGGSLFGFGGDRALQVTVGPGKFGANSRSGISLGGERLGVDSIFDIDENKGINLGSFLNSHAQHSLGSQSSPGNDLRQLLHSLMSVFSSGSKSSATEIGLPPPSIVGGIENKRGESRKTSPFPWPTPVTPTNLAVETTTEGIFPTLVNNWKKEENKKEFGNGFIPMGVIDGHGIDSTRKPFTTEGRSGPITNQRVGEQSNINSGESNKKTGKKRFGPLPPDGLIDIDSKEEFKRRT